MTAEEVTELLEKLVEAAELLCQETAHLVEERVSRTPLGLQDGVFGKSRQLREVGQELRRALLRVQ
jgi:hypothetical protein